MKEIFLCGDCGKKFSDVAGARKHIIERGRKHRMQKVQVPVEEYLKLVEKEKAVRRKMQESRMAELRQNWNQDKGKDDYGLGD